MPSKKKQSVAVQIIDDDKGTPGSFQTSSTNNDKGTPGLSDKHAFKTSSTLLIIS